MSPAKDVSPNDLDLRSSHMRPGPESTLLKDVQTRVLESGVTIKPTMKKKGKKMRNNKMVLTREVVIKTVDNLTTGQPSKYRQIGSGLKSCR